MGRQGRALQRQRFSLDSMADAYAEIIGRLMAQRDGGGRPASAVPAQSAIAAGRR